MESNVPIWLFFQLESQHRFYCLFSVLYLEEIGKCLIFVISFVSQFLKLHDLKKKPRDVFDLNPTGASFNSESKVECASGQATTAYPGLSCIKW